MNSHERVKWWRKRRGLSQAALGELVGMKQYTISKIENGVTPVDLDDLEKMAKVFKVSLVEFFGKKARRAA